MKKSLQIFLAILTVIALTLPASLTAQAIDMPYWHESHNTTGLAVPPDDAEILNWDGTYNNASGGNLGAKYLCTGTECEKIDVYYSLTIEFDYKVYYQQAGDDRLKLQWGYGAAGLQTEYFNCDSDPDPGQWGHCSVSIYRVLDAEDIVGGVDKYHYLKWNIENVSPSTTLPTDRVWTLTAWISGLGAENTECDDAWYNNGHISGEQYGTPITVTSEEGYALTNLVPGNYYKLVVAGGPWDDGDGNDERRDTALKLGDDDWVPLETLAASPTAECVDVGDPSHTNKYQITFVWEATDADFSIRVNDTAGNFADNTDPGITVFDVYLVGPATTGTDDCSGQFLLGPQIGTINLSSQNEFGANLSTATGMDYPKTGEWIAIRVTSGWWKNQGAGEELRTLAIKQGGGTWFPLDVNPTTGCADEANDTYYVQMTTSLSPLYLRVNDSSDFLSNTGTLAIALYAISIYTPFTSGCALNYTIGDFIETKIIQGDFSNGVLIDGSNLNWDPIGGVSDYVAPKRYYMLETFGGPVSLGNDVYTFEADLRQMDSSEDPAPPEWHNIQTAPFVECVVQTDVVGHVKAFFALDEQVDLYEFLRYWYAIRVRDTGDFTNNSGTLSYKLYMATDIQVIDPGTVPEVDGCIQFSHVATPASETIIYGPDDDGSRLGSGALTNATIYALQVEDGPWEDDSVESYNVQISNNDGYDWYDLKDYPYLLCSQSEDGDHIVIYVTGASGQIWRARVDDGDSDFENNTLSITMTVYPGQTSIDPNPTCEENYTLTYIGDYTVPGNIESGEAIPEILGGEIYSIQVTGDAMWYDDGGTTGSYLLQISDDGGDTWENLLEAADLCAEQIGNYGLFQVYFTAAAGEYRLRVQDDADFPANTGSVVVKLYSGQETGNPIPGGELPPEWVVACDEIQPRPDGVIDWQPITIPTNWFTGYLLNNITISIPIPRVAAWLNYIRYTITYYFAWCPEHTDMLKSIGEVYMDREPLASIIAMRNFVVSIQTTIEGFTAVGGAGTPLESMEPDLFSDIGTLGEVGGGASVPVSSNPLDLFVVGNVSTENNPWFGGDLVLSSEPTFDASVMDDYRALCEDKFYSLFGITTWGYCYIMGTMRFTKVVTWVLLIMDLSILIWYLLKYFPGWLKRMWAAITGNKDILSNISGGGAR